ncbi:MAG: double-strand break repair protein AddB, partial [Paracoccus sp. (in: a-proteobacteria)]|nr:double-strand break repair protein AddB [Paracoccus sp. (in: a-proteobacteria)]
MREGGLFALPPGVDFADAFVRGLRARMGDAPPEALARVTVYLNSGRTLTAVRVAFDRHGATLLPRLRLLAELGAPGAALASPLARQLELGQLLQALLEREPDLAAGQSIPQLADSLAELMAEMQTEGCGPDALDAVDVGDHAAHWARARRFLTIAADYYLT